MIVGMRVHGEIIRGELVTGHGIASTMILRKSVFERVLLRVFTTSLKQHMF
jgi:hypothetical protein